MCVTTMLVLVYSPILLLEVIAHVCMVHELVLGLGPHVM
jgi:hypothetical protein